MPTLGISKKSSLRTARDTERRAGNATEAIDYCSFRCWQNFRVVLQFCLVPKTNGKVRLYLELAWLNKALIRLINRGTTLNDILPKLAGDKYVMVLDPSSRYHNLKPDEKSSYLIIFSCPFGRYWYIRLLFGVALLDGMVQKNIPDVFGSAGGNSNCRVGCTW